MEDIVGQLFSLLDVEYAKTGKKAVKFEPTFAALGLLFDLSEFDSGVVAIRHTEKRTSEILDFLNQVLGDKALSVKQAEILRGRLHWFNLTCSAELRVTLCVGSPCGLRNGTQARFGREFGKCHPYLQGLLGKCSAFETLPFQRTQRISSPMDRSSLGWTPLLALGGVLYDQAGNPVQYFSSEIAGSDLEALLGDSDHPIYEVELAAVMRILDAERRSLSRPWYGRVPSHSNPADAPSKLLGSSFILLVGRSLRFLSVQRASRMYCCPDCQGTHACSLPYSARIRQRGRSRDLGPELRLSRGALTRGSQNQA